MKKFLSLALALILLCGCASALAEWPEHPITVLIPANTGGDTDTTAAICLGLALIRPESQTLAPALWDDLENKPFGRDYLKEAGDNLSKTFPALIPA